MPPVLGHGEQFRETLAFRKHVVAAKHDGVEGAVTRRCPPLPVFKLQIRRLHALKTIRRQLVRVVIVHVPYPVRATSDNFILRVLAKQLRFDTERSGWTKDQLRGAVEP